MKRLLSAISVLCILFLIVQTSREYQESSAYTYAYVRMTLPTGKPEAEVLESVRSLYRMRAEREEMGDWYFYSSYAKEIYAEGIAYYHVKDLYGYNYEYIEYTYEDDYDRNGSKEAFVAIGQKIGDTTESFAAYVVGNDGVIIETAGKESLYMVDQNESGEWEMYEFLHEDYCRQLRKHFNTVIDGDDTWFVFDGQRIGAPELFNNEVQSYRYDVENQIEFEFTPDGIEITAEVESIRTSAPWGINDYPDYQISAQVKHLGNGNWQLSDVRCRTYE